MGTFIEQIVAIKKTGKTYMTYVGIILLSFAIIVASYLFLPIFTLIIASVVIFGAYKLAIRLSIEYEYIITNTTMDIDKIIAKSSRKRMISFEIPSIQRVEKYTGTLPANIEKDCFIACNKNDENAYVIYYKEDGKPQKTLVFAPNEQVRETIKGILPRYIGETL